MEITDAVIDRLAALSRLRFNPEEKAAIKSDFQNLLKFVDKLNELDTTGVEPLLHITRNENVLREDRVAADCNRAEALKNAPGNDGQFFKVPKVIKK